MKQLLYGAFTTLIMFGIGKAIYEKGKDDAVKEYKTHLKAMEIGFDIGNKSKK